MAKKSDSKAAAKPLNKKLAAKPAAAPKPATASARQATKTVAAAATAKSKAPTKVTAKPAVQKSTPPTAAKKPTSKSKAELHRLQLSGEAATAGTSAMPPVTEERPAKQPAGFFFLSQSIDPQVTLDRPTPASLAGRVKQFGDFADVRQHAIDYLVDLIDRCEVRLWQIKRADSLETLQQLVREHDHPARPAASEEAPPTPS